MKLGEMLISMKRPTLEQPKQDVFVEPQTVSRRVDDTKIDKVMDEISELKKFLQNPSTNQIAPDNYEDTNLSDEEIDDIISTMIGFEERYFSEIPLKQNLDNSEKKFVWNIPKVVYEAHQYANERGDDVLDPLICIYALLTEDPLYTMGVYMKALRGLIEKEDEYVNKSCEEYYSALNEEEE